MGKVRFNQSGYIGQSMSLRASRAKDNGEQVLSSITAADLKELGIGLTLKAFKAACKSGEIEPSSWHHTGKFAQKTLFYHLEDLTYSGIEDPATAELLKLDLVIAQAYFDRIDAEEAARKKRAAEIRAEEIRREAKRKISFAGFWDATARRFMNFAASMALPAFNAKKIKIRFPKAIGLPKLRTAAVEPVTIIQASPKKPGERIPVEV